MSPSSASLRKHRRHSANFRRYARGRPHRRQRLRSRILNLGGFCSFAIFAVVAIVVASLLGGAASPRDSLFSYGSSGLAAVRHGAYKAHFLIPPPGNQLGASRPSEGAPQLYDLDQDPSEKFDLAARHPEIVGELRRMADDHKKTIVAVKDQIATRTGTAGRAR